MQMQKGAVAREPAGDPSGLAASESTILTAIENRLRVDIAQSGTDAVGRAFTVP